MGYGSINLLASVPFTFTERNLFLVVATMPIPTEELAALFSLVRGGLRLGECVAV